MQSAQACITTTPRLHQNGKGNLGAESIKAVCQNNSNNLFVFPLKPQSRGLQKEDSLIRQRVGFWKRQRERIESLIEQKNSILVNLDWFFKIKSVLVQNRIPTSYSTIQTLPKPNTSYKVCPNIKTTDVLLFLSISKTPKTSQYSPTQF